MRYRGRRAEDEDEEEVDDDSEEDPESEEDEEEEAFGEDEDDDSDDEEEEAADEDTDEDEDLDEEAMDEEDEDEERSLSWTWDFAHKLRKGGDRKARKARRVLVSQRAKEDDDEHRDGTTLFVASTDDEDRMMDIVRQDWDQGGRLRDFRRNPVILDNHNHLRTVGRGIEAKVPRVGDDAGKLMIRVEWNLSSPDPTLAAVGHAHLNGYRSAGSVGFNHGQKTARHLLDTSDPYFRQPIEVETWWGGTVEMSGWLFEKNTLIEFSSATIPANANALQRSLIRELGLLEPGDIDRRVAVVGKTVPKRVAEDLRAYFQSPKHRKAALDLLWPDLLEKARKDPTFRRMLRALADGSGSPSSTSRSAPDLLEQVAALLE